MSYQNDCSLRSELLEQIAVEGMETVPGMIRLLINKAMESERRQYLKA